ncbi:hypothetical protein SLA2020_368090 [Shorea laevis]
MAGGPPRRRAAIKALPLLCPRRTEHAAGDSHRRGTGQPYDPDGSRRTTQRSHNGRNGSARIFDRLGTARAHQTLVSAQNQRGSLGVAWGFTGALWERVERRRRERVWELWGVRVRLRLREKQLWLVVLFSRSRTGRRGDSGSGVMGEEPFWVAPARQCWLWWGIGDNIQIKTRTHGQNDTHVIRSKLLESLCTTSIGIETQT